MFFLSVEWGWPKFKMSIWNPNIFGLTIRSFNRKESTVPLYFSNLINYHFTVPQLVSSNFYKKIVWVDFPTSKNLGHSKNEWKECKFSFFFFIKRKFYRKAGFSFFFSWDINIKNYFQYGIQRFGSLNLSSHILEFK